MNTVHTPLVHTETSSWISWKDESLQEVLERVQSGYRGTFELIEDPNDPGSYYDGPY